MFFVLWMLPNNMCKLHTKQIMMLGLIIETRIQIVHMYNYFQHMYNYFRD